MSRFNDLAESIVKSIDRIRELEAENAELRRKAAAWDWCDANERFPVCSAELNWNDFTTPLEAVEAAMKQEAK